MGISSWNNDLDRGLDRRVLHNSFEMPLAMAVWEVVYQVLEEPMLGVNHT